MALRRALAHLARGREARLGPLADSVLAAEGAALRRAGSIERTEPSWQVLGALDQSISLVQRAQDRAPSWLPDQAGCS